jgi:hypothetical protein
MEQLRKFAITSITPISFAELEKIAEDTANVLLSLPEDKRPTEPPKFDDLQLMPDDFIYVGNDIMKSFEIVKGSRGKEVIQIPIPFLEDDKILAEYYEVGFIEGELLHKTDPRIVKTDDTKKLTLKNKCFKCFLTGEYYEKESSVIELTSRRSYISKKFEKDLVVTKDLGVLDLKSECYRSSKGDYYSHYELSPDYVPDPNNPPRFNLTKKVNKTGRLIGVEFELEDSVPASVEVLKTDMKDIFYLERDGSLNRTGNEFVSVPLTLSEMPFIVKSFLTMAKKQKASASARCGYHVHVGLTDYDHTDIVKLVLLGKNVQEAFYDLVDPSRRKSRFCRGLDERFTGFEKTNSMQECGIKLYGSGHNYESRPNQSKWAQNDIRHYWLNIDRFFRFRNEKEQQTVEFRLHEATFNHEKFVKFTQLCHAMVEFAKNNSLKEVKKATIKDIAIYSGNSLLLEYVSNIVTTKPCINMRENENPNVIANLEEVI